MFFLFPSCCDTIWTKKKYHTFVLKEQGLVLGTYHLWPWTSWQQAGPGFLSYIIGGLDKSEFVVTQGHMHETPLTPYGWGHMEHAVPAVPGWNESYDNTQAV